MGFAVGVAIAGAATCACADSIGSVSVRCGYHGWDDMDDVDYSGGAQTEVRVNLGASPLEIVLRGHCSYTEFDGYHHRHSYRDGHDRKSVEYEAEEKDLSTFGGSIQLQLDIMRGELVNPYVAAGAMYERTDGETYVRHSYYLRDGRHYERRDESQREEWDEDGFAFVGRAGLELSTLPFRIRLEAAYVSELYDDEAFDREEKGQMELNAIIGFDVIEPLGIEFSGTYFTEWEETFFLVGATFRF